MSVRETPIKSKEKESSWVPGAIHIDGNKSTHQSHKKIKPIKKIRSYRKERFFGIDWLVISEDTTNKNKILLLSEYVLECRCYHHEHTVWHNSELYRYLNGEFYDKFGFNKKRVPFTQYVTGYPMAEVFLLSYEEVEKYLDNDTKIAKSEKDKNITLPWWILPSHEQPRTSRCINTNGKTMINKSFSFKSGIRPAIWYDSGIIDFYVDTDVNP